MIAAAEPIIKDGRLTNGGLRAAFVVATLRDCGSIEQTAKRLGITEEDVHAVLSLASACLSRCVE
jgi:DNA-directed RNA polymerase specialized sigma24 family protein